MGAYNWKRHSIDRIKLRIMGLEEGSADFAAVPDQKAIEIGEGMLQVARKLPYTEVDEVSGELVEFWIHRDFIFIVSAAHKNVITVIKCTYLSEPELDRQICESLSQKVFSLQEQLDGVRDLQEQRRHELFQEAQQLDAEEAVIRAQLAELDARRKRIHAQVEELDSEVRTIETDVEVTARKLVKSIAWSQDALLRKHAREMRK